MKYFILTILAIIALVAIAVTFFFTIVKLTIGLALIGISALAFLIVYFLWKKKTDWCWRIFQGSKKPIIYILPLSSSGTKLFKGRIGMCFSSMIILFHLKTWLSFPTEVIKRTKPRQCAIKCKSFPHNLLQKLSCCSPNSSNWTTALKSVFLMMMNWGKWFGIFR